MMSQQKSKHDIARDQIQPAVSAVREAEKNGNLQETKTALQKLATTVGQLPLDEQSRRTAERIQSDVSSLLHKNELEDWHKDVRRILKRIDKLLAHIQYQEKQQQRKEKKHEKRTKKQQTEEEQTQNPQ